MFNQREEGRDPADLQLFMLDFEKGDGCLHLLGFESQDDAQRCRYLLQSIGQYEADAVFPMPTKVSETHADEHDSGQPAERAHPCRARR